MLRIVTLIAAVFLPLTLHAQCAGRNLVTALAATEQADLRSAAQAVPFPDGNLWRATRGRQTVHIVGTYHFDDPRHDAILTAVAPLIAGAEVLLVEAGPDEEAALSERMAREPRLMTIVDGPTMPELLPEAEWQALSAAMKARGVPGFMAAKLQPWFLSLMLGIPPCDMARMANGRGLDQRLMHEATARGLPIKALEPYDTLFVLFEKMTQADQLSMIRSALTMEPQAEDMSVTLADLYFAQESRVIWELMRHLTLTAPDVDPELVAQDLALLETTMMTDRNRAWIPVIESAAAKGPVAAAFGALHLSGEQGVLNLLAQKGFKIERLPF